MRWRPSKYGSIPTHCACGGLRFPSRKEARRFAELVLLEKAGTIEQLYTQVPFKFESGVTYIADFVYRENGAWVAEDTKGMKTRVYMIKAKLFVNEYPQFELRES